MADIDVPVIKKLGKERKKEDVRNLMAARYLASTFPASYDWQKRRTPVPARTFGNTHYGDCTLASQANGVVRFERVEQFRTVLIPDQTVIRNYLEMTGGQDTGYYELDAIKRWRTTGFDYSSTRRYTIEGFAEVNPRVVDEIKAALYQFKVIKVCFALPWAWSNIDPEGYVAPGGTTGLWDVGEGPNFEPNSWGGHCIAGSTPIALLRGEDVPIADLVGERDLWVYGSTSDGSFVPSKAASVVKSGVKTTLNVVLDDGTSLRVTPEHRFLMRDGQYRAARDLVSGDSLMPLYRRINAEGYEEIETNGEWEATHRLVGRSLGLPRGHGWVVHHADINKRNNEPSNLKSLTWLDHRKIHAERSWAETYNRTEKGRARSRETMSALWADPEWRARMLQEVRPWERVKSPNYWFATDEGREFISRRAGDERPCANCGDPVYRPQFLSEGNRFCSTSCTNEWTKTAGSERFKQSLRRAWTPERRAATSERSKQMWAGRRNHKVVTVEAGREEAVYDLVGVDPTSNFSAGGVYVHNSMLADKYDQYGLTVVHSWFTGPTPARQLVTWAAVQKYCDEAYSIVDSFDYWRTQAAVFDAKLLAKDVEKVTSE